MSKRDERHNVLVLGNTTKGEVLRAYHVSDQFGHDIARRYIFETAEAVAVNEGREAAASMVYEIADTIVGRLPLPVSMIPAPAPAAVKRAWWRHEHFASAIVFILFLVGLHFFKVMD